MEILFIFNFSMREFLLHLLALILAVSMAFVVAAAWSSYSGFCKGLFFQPKDSVNTDTHTILGIEQALADSVNGGILVVGSSVCKNSIQPELLGELLDIEVNQLCTGGQSVQGALRFAEFLSQRIKPQMVLVDLYPRVGEDQIVEGCMRIALAHPDGRSDLARFNALSVTRDWNLLYLWSQSWIEGWFPTKIEVDSSLIPGYKCVANKSPMPVVESKKEVAVDSVALSCIREWHANNSDVKLLINLPPIHGGVFNALEGESFIALPPRMVHDTCFFDSHHMRCECSDAYTHNLAESLLPYLP